ncbi:hypothetical protein QJV45_09920 [Listeria booriae]|uniref:hypothetical protein n=1 Tax=Listeria booriae TaxID=1552123 RepID=UPI0028804B15|nr:hypothetical protein [Listeria booriae]MDT0110784.1 hypothetical protein [Listeria booriae]
MKKTRVTWVVILAVASLIVAVASLAVSTIQARYTVRELMLVISGATHIKKIRVPQPLKLRNIGLVVKFIMA